MTQKLEMDGQKLKEEAKKRRKKKDVLQKQHTLLRSLKDK
jgi:hypothetical protein